MSGFLRIMWTLFLRGANSVTDRMAGFYLFMDIHRPSSFDIDLNF